MIELVEPKIVAIIQARMSSTRLQGKVLKLILGKPMLSRVVVRTKRAKLLGDVVVGTTVQSADDSIAQLCRVNGWSYFRGSESDVLDRYFRAAEAHEADVVVRITSDCPLVDPELVDKLIRVFLDGQERFDYVSTTLRPTLPRGLDVEVVRFSALKRAWEEDQNPLWREHATLYIRRHPDLFRLQNVMNNQDHSGMRWTVDTREDLEFVRTIYRHFGHDRFSWHDVLAAVHDHPDWLAINSHIKQKTEPV